MSLGTGRREGLWLPSVLPCILHQCSSWGGEADNLLLPVLGYRKPYVMVGSKGHQPQDQQMEKSAAVPGVTRPGLILRTLLNQSILLDPWV